MNNELERFVPWTQSEIQNCRRYYPNYTKLQAQLPDRSLSAISNQCQRLGLVKARHLWSEGEIAQLTALYPKSCWQELLNAFPFATIESLRSMAGKLKLYRTFKS